MLNHFLVQTTITSSPSTQNGQNEKSIPEAKSLLDRKQMKHTTVGKCSKNTYYKPSVSN